MSAIGKMNFYGWEDRPEPTRRQVRNLLKGLKRLLGGDLAGVYLHGSLAMDCFNPATSDIDLLAVVARRIPRNTRKPLVELLLSLSGSPHPIEISFLRPGHLAPWRHPAPFELHYSETWRKRIGADLAAGAWKHLEQKGLTDPDLAAHITVTNARGIRLAGRSIRRIFPVVPRKDYLAAITADLKWSDKRLTKDPVYAVLNACRLIAYLREGRICSKAEGAARALELLPDEFHRVIQISLESYGGLRNGKNDLDMEIVKRLLRSADSEARSAV